MPVKPSAKPTQAFELEQETYQGAGDLSGLAQYCMDLYQEYSGSQYRTDKLKEIKDGRARYKNDRATKTFPWPGCSNISVGLTAIAVDNLEPRIKAQVISSDDFLECKPVGKEDVAQAEGVKEFLQWALRSNVKVNTSIKPLIHNLLKDGTIDVLPVWRERVSEYRTRALVPEYSLNGQTVKVPEGQRIDPAQAEQMGLEVTGLKDSYETKERTRWRVEYVLVPLNDAYFPDNWDGWDDAPYMRMIYPTLEELELQSDKHGGPYREIDKELVLEGARNDDDSQDERLAPDIKYSEYTKEVRVLECYVKWRGEWTIVSFAVDRAWREIRRQPLKEVYWTGTKPIKRFRLYPESETSMGTGLPQKIKDFAVAIDDLWNEMIDSGTVEIIPWFLYQAGPGFSQIDLELYPGKGVPVPKDSQVTFPNLGIKAPQFMTFINLLMGFFERTISLSDYSMGKEGAIGGKGAETFSGMNLIVQEGNVKHAYTGETIREAFAELFGDTLALYGQYMPLDAVRRIRKDNEWTFQPVDVVALQGEYDVDIEVSSASANKMLHRKEQVELTQILSGNPAVNPVELAERILKAYDIRETEDLLNPAYQLVIAALQQAPEVAELIQKYMQQKQEQQKQAEVEQQAKDNIQREEIQRRVEQESGYENSKLIDQVTEGTKRKILTPIIEESAAREVMNGAA